MLRGLVLGVALIVLVAASSARAASTSCAGLGAAITAANAAPGPDVIDLKRGSMCRIGAELPLVTDPLTIDGHGAWLRPAPGKSMILLDADGWNSSVPVTLTVTNLTLSGASTAIWAYFASVVVDHSRLQNNGDGVYAIHGNALATFSRIARNGLGLYGQDAAASDSQLLGNGTAIQGLLGAWADRSLVRHNGTAITGEEGASASESTIDWNGTGLSARDYVDLRSSRLNDNETGLRGGRTQIFDSAVARNANVGGTNFDISIARATFYDNAHGLEASNVNISNSTFAHGEELFVRGGSVDFTTITGTLHSDEALNVTNSILQDCDGIFAEEDRPSIAAGNVSLDTDCPGRAVTADPLLRPLRFNGGTTPTQALGARSPARDLIDCGPSSDQRGFPRPSGPACDAGAFEAQVSSAPKLPARG